MKPIYSKAVCLTFISDLEIGLKCVKQESEIITMGKLDPELFVFPKD